MGITCKKCGKPKPNGGRCRACQRAYVHKRYAENPELYKNYNQKWAKKHPDKKKSQQDRWRSKHPEQWKKLRQKWSSNWKKTTIRGVLTSALAPRHSGKHQVSINTDYLIDLWEQQKGLCALTNMPMAIAPNDLKRVSIDRIDNSKGYIPGNVQLVCQWVNTAKKDYTNEEFLILLEELRNNPACGGTNPH